MAKKPQLKMVRWFDRVRYAYESSDDFDRQLNALEAAIQNATDYYDAILEDAAKHLLVTGHLQTLLAETPGLAFYYNGFHTDALQVRKWLELLHDQMRAVTYKWFVTDPDAKAEYGKLGPTDVNNFVKGDDNLYRIANLIRTISDRQHLLEDVRDGFERRGMVLAKLVDLRVAGLQEVWVDASRETTDV